jgi:hypothetical protein
MGWLGTFVGIKSLDVFGQNVQGPDVGETIALQAGCLRRDVVVMKTSISATSLYSTLQLGRLDVRLFQHREWSVLSSQKGLNAARFSYPRVIIHGIGKSAERKLRKTLGSRRY